MFRRMKSAMQKKLRTEVRFQSSTFNTSEPKDYYINDCCYGDDLCIRLIQELRSLGYLTDETPEQEDFGWGFHYFACSVEHRFLVGYQPGESSYTGKWIGWIERQAGLLGSIFGRRKRGVLPEAATAIHSALSHINSIHDIHWHYPNSSDENDGTDRPIKYRDE
jgi:hypothetical protein